MDKKNFTFCGKLLFVLLIFNTLNVFAQWQADYRLTNSPYPSYASSNNMWCVAASGNFVHVVWYDNRNGSYEIYYKRSTDGGTNWEADVRLTNDPAASLAPAIAVSGQVIHVVWSDNRPGNYEIYYKRSTDAGVTWGTDIRLRNNSADATNPSVCVSGSVVNAVWEDNRDGNLEIYQKRSTDGGISWGSDVRLTNNFASSFLPHISVTGLIVHVVWADVRDGNGEIYYKRSTDAGISWSADTRLTNHTGDKDYPSVSSTGSDVHVVWSDQRDGNREIYYKGSTDNGVTWGADTRLTNDPAVSSTPSVASSGSVVHVVWNENRDANFEIYYKRSTNRGLSWQADSRLTNDPDISEHPSVTTSGTYVHVVWDDGRDGNLEIYYKRDPTGNPIGIINIGSEIPDGFSLSQNYPNPFNPSTKIQFTIPHSSFVRMVVYDLLGREIETLVKQNLNAGAYSVDWGASKYSSGVYFYRIQTERFTDTKKMLLIK